MSSREQILERLKNAGWVSGQLPAPVIGPHTPQTGNIDAFITGAQTASARVERVDNPGAARELIAEYIKEQGITRVIASDDSVMVELQLPELARRENFSFRSSAELKGQDYREYVLGSELGISGCSYGVAETGTIVISHDHSNERLVSHAPDHYIGIIYADQILTDRFSLTSILQASPSPPAAWTLITGVSRTADVALQVVLGMHGPRKVTIIVIG